MTRNHFLCASETCTFSLQNVLCLQHIHNIILFIACWTVPPTKDENVPQTMNNEPAFASEETVGAVVHVKEFALNAGKIGQLVNH